jgi:hypothetical protein
MITITQEDYTKITEGSPEPLPRHLVPRLIASNRLSPSDLNTHKYDSTVYPTQNKII